MAFTISKQSMIWQNVDNKELIMPKEAENGQAICGIRFKSDECGGVFN